MEYSEENWYLDLWSERLKEVLLQLLFQCKRNIICCKEKTIERFSGQLIIITHELDSLEGGGTH